MQNQSGQLEIPNVGLATSVDFMTTNHTVGATLTTPTGDIVALDHALKGVTKLITRLTSGVNREQNGNIVVELEREMLVEEHVFPHIVVECTMKKGNATEHGLVIGAM
ncbi:hypothetical protein ACJMK2_022180 [Sinanodonta woodiana]|uniref:Uncharacterized protein n=1 Tax=Sinanodonta woodiana TaxID=1069815 RepID=A0ABD3TKT9_SINWO